MNKKYSLTFLLLIVFFNVSIAQAFDIPSYIKDPQDVPGNINIIIEHNTPNYKNAQSAYKKTEVIEETIIEYATRLYAEAYVVMASMSDSKADKAKKAAKKLLQSKDEQEVLGNEIKSKMVKIAQNVKKIIELEAGIANLEGAVQFKSIGEIKLDDEEDEDGKKK